MTDDSTHAELKRLETSLWVAETRYDRDYLEQTFHPDFTEVGQSGRVWTRAEAMAISPAGPSQDAEIDIELPLPEYDVTLLGPDVALARYLSRGGLDQQVDQQVDRQGTHHRTSIWVRTDDAWQLRFHQGTPATDR